jgi:uncharacterized protein HemX
MTPRHNPTAEERDVSWKIDRHIPLALILTVFAQGAAIVWWGSGMDSRLSTETARNDRQDVQIEATRSALSAQEVSFATAAAELRGMRDSITEMKETLTEQNKLLREILTNGKRP